MKRLTIIFEAPQQTSKKQKERIASGAPRFLSWSPGAPYGTLEEPIA